MDQRNSGKKIKLHFDGKRLNATENGRYSGGWDGVSGAEYYQRPSDQHLPDRGPIPESVYSVGELQYPPRGGWDRFWGHLNRGKWPKLERAWGNSRAFLQHKAGDNPAFDHRGGNDFSIHGGSVPGSAGCVDLTDQMDRFADFYKKTGESADLIVSYPEYQNDIYPDPASDGGASPGSQSGIRRPGQDGPRSGRRQQDGRWNPDPTSQNRRPFGGISLRDALRFLE
ncbi:hypothetical protein QM996_09215 [Sinorhizobium chiapasense]